MVPLWKLGLLTAMACLCYAAVPLADPIVRTIEVTEGSAITATAGFRATFPLTVNSVTPSNVFLGGDPKDALAMVNIVNDKCTGMKLDKGDTCDFGVKSTTNKADPGPLKDGVNEVGAIIAFTNAQGMKGSNSIPLIIQVDDVLEPTSLAILGTGLAGLGLICRRRRGG